MAELKIWLLGPPKIARDGTLIKIQRQKSVALLAYLAITGEAQPRDTLATLFWPDSDQSRARSSLRRDLSILNKTLGGEWLQISRDSVDLSKEDLWVDVIEFKQQLEKTGFHGHEKDTVCSACFHPLINASDLYRDIFLTGFSLIDSPKFDNWQFFQADTLQQKYASVLNRLVEGYSTQGNYEQAISYARRLVSLDPLHEPAQRQLVQLFALNSQKAAALRQYQLFVQALKTDMGLVPEPETVELYERIRSSSTVSQATKQKSRVPDANLIFDETVGLHNFPIPPTQFVGRVEGLTGIIRQISDPACRLLTITGPGGIGKTRIAIQATKNLSIDVLRPVSVSDGIFFVSLGDARLPWQMIPAIAEALNFSFYQDVNPQDQLLNYLRHKNMLLVLDNFEHLLSDDNASDGDETTAEDILQAVLQTAPKVKILVTSREALNIPEEWIFLLNGMRYPKGTSSVSEDFSSEINGYSAVKLFEQSARRVQPDFSLENTANCVQEICRLVDGLPLAIELAAAWLKVLSCDEIALEIERNLDILSTTQKGISSRHRSMRAVLEHSWQMLMENDQMVLKRLSIFRGGFQLEAAKEVSSAKLSDLVTLVEKSLLQTTKTGRYRIHELLRQFLVEKLAKSPNVLKETQDRHRAYFIAILPGQDDFIAGYPSQKAFENVRLERQNIRSAWKHALKRPDYPEIRNALESWHAYLLISSRFQEGVDFFSRMLETLPDDQEELKLILLNRVGAHQTQLGQLSKARISLEEGLRLARKNKYQNEIATALDFLGNIVNIQADSRTARELYEESLEISRNIKNLNGAANSLYNLGWIALSQGDHARSKPFFEECLTLYKEISNHDGVARVRDSMGVTAFYLGDYVTAKRNFKESLEICTELTDQRGIARAWGGLGLVAWGLGGDHLKDARQHLETSLKINKKIGHRLEISRRLGFLGSVSNSQGEFDTAQDYFFQCQTLSQEIGSTFGSAWALNGLGQSALGQGDQSIAQAYFDEALSEAWSSQDVSIVLYTLISQVELCHSEFGSAQSFEILNHVFNHPATWQVMKTQARQLMGKISSQLSNEELDENRKKRKITTLSQIINRISNEHSGKDSSKFP